MNRSEIFKTAWSNFKKGLFSTFGDSLKNAWSKVVRKIKFNRIPVGSNVMYSTFGGGSWKAKVIAPNTLKWEDDEIEEINGNIEAVINKNFNYYTANFQVIL